MSIELNTYSFCKTNSQPKRPAYPSHGPCDSLLKWILFIVLGFLQFTVTAQQQIDTAYYNKALSKALKISSQSPEEALSIFKDIEQKAKNDNYVYGSLNAAYGIGKCLFNEGHYNRAEPIFDSVAVAAEQENLLPLLAVALYDKGRALWQKAQYYSAAQEFISCIKINESIKDYVAVGRSHNMLGNVYLDLEDYEAAMDNFAKAIAFANKTGDKIDYFMAYGNYNSCLILKEKFSEALNNLNSLARELRDFEGDYKIYLWVFLEVDRLKCKPSLKVLDEIYNNLLYLERQLGFQNTFETKGYLYSGFVRHYLLKNDPINAKQYLGILKSLLASVEDEKRFWDQEVILLESMLCGLQGVHERALTLYGKYMEKKIYLFKNNKSNQVHQLTLNYEKEKKEAELAAKDMQLQVMAASADKRQWSLIVRGAVTFLLALISLAIYLRHKNLLLKVARKEALQASRTKSRFLDVMSHELRTPLSTIAGAVYLLEEGEDNETQENHVRDLKFASEYLNKLVENTIVLKTLGESSEERGKEGSPQGQRFHCKTLIQGVCESIVHSHNKNKVKIHMDPDIPEYLVGPELDLGRILTNLVTNSDKFTQSGLISVSVEKNQDLYPEGMELTFTVEDNGQGIREEEKEKIFDPFFTGKEHKYHEYPGMGLGLNLVKGLLEKHGSAPKMESVYALGTTIRFSLRFQKAEAPIEAAPSKEVVLKRPQGKVLLVEDNIVNQEITQKIIQGLGYQCEVADNGKMALEKYREGSFDLVLMDILMPVMDGFEASASIYNLDAKANIVALTAVSKEKYRDLFKKLNIKTVIHKPINAMVIKKVLHDHVPLGPRAA